MKISASIELVWNIAVQEAIAAEFNEIEPEHFFEALLKMTEIPMYQYKQMALNESIINQLNTELQSICKELNSLNIDSKTIRRSLRSQLGKGGRPFQGGTMHRSSTSRERFDRMARIAANKGTEVIMLEHMLEALIESPTSAIVEVLGKILKEKKGVKKVKSPLLNEYGRDIIQQVANGELRATTDRKAESSALINALSEKNQKSVLFICDNHETVHSIIIGAVYSILNQKSKSVLKNKRFIDISFLMVDKDNEQIVKLNQIFLEWNKSQDVILFVPSIESQSLLHGKDEWITVLKTVLRKGKNQVICHTKPDIYNNFIEKDTSWKRLFHIIWISDKKNMDIPDEL